jgi:hypothetical protein
MDDYTDIVLGRQPRPKETEPAKAPPPAIRANGVNPALKKKIQKIDLNILKLKDKIEVLDRALADQSLYADEPRKAADFARLRAKLAADLEAEETLWLEAHEAVL